MTCSFLWTSHPFISMCALSCCLIDSRKVLTVLLPDGEWITELAGVWNGWFGALIPLLAAIPFASEHATFLPYFVWLFWLVVFMIHVRPLWSILCINIYIGRLEMGCLKLGYPKSTGLSIIIITYCIFEIFCVHQVFRHTHRLIADIISRYTVFWPFPLKIEWWVMIFTLSCTISLNHQGLIGITWGMSSSKKTHPRPMEYIDCFWWYYCFCPHNWKPKRYVSWKLILWYSSVFVAIVLPVWTIIATSQRPQRTQHTWCETIGVIKPDVVQIYELQNNITSGKHVWW